MTDEEIFYHWREAEAYQVPMTEVGQQKADLRWRGYKKGWTDAIAYLEKRMDSGCIERGCACFDDRVDKRD